MKQFIKDPDAVLDYKMDWTAWLDETDVIVASSWEVDSEEIVVDSDSFTDTDATVWLSGGLNRKKYLITNSIETDDGRKDDRSFLIKCLEQ